MTSSHVRAPSGPTVDPFSEPEVYYAENEEGWNKAHRRAFSAVSSSVAGLVVVVVVGGQPLTGVYKNVKSLNREDIKNYLGNIPLRRGSHGNVFPERAAGGKIDC